MKKKNIIIVVLIYLFIYGGSYTQDVKTKIKAFPVLKGPYLGQKPPGLKPVLFAPEIMNAEHGYHTAVIFSPDFTEAYWSPMERGPSLMYSKVVKGCWTSPQKVTFGLKMGIGDAAFSTDGEKLYFLSFHPPKAKDPERERIWFIEREIKGWSKPKLIDQVIVNHPTHWTFSFANNKNLYFTSEIDGVKGEQDIYIARFDGKKYLAPKDLGDAINSDGMDLTPFIAPDESYLIFTRKGKNTRKTDLYISFRNSDLSWTKAVDMGGDINTEFNDLDPYVSPDGKYLFFLSNRAGKYKIYWMDAKIIDELKPEKLK